MDGGALVAKVFDAFDRSADGYLNRDELFEFFSKVVAPGALLKQLKVETIEAAAEATGYGGLLRSAAGVELHCHNVRDLCFAGTSLFSASDDEVATWKLPLV